MLKNALQEKAKAIVEQKNNFEVNVTKFQSLLPFKY